MHIWQNTARWKCPFDKKPPPLPFSNPSWSTEDAYYVNLDDVVYPGKLLKVDDDKQEATVLFMEETQGKGDLKLFKWPLWDDVQGVEFEQFVREIQEPTACNKSKRQFKLEDSHYTFFDTTFNSQLLVAKAKGSLCSLFCEYWLFWQVSGTWTRK